jgi:hypothetical protein
MVASRTPIHHRQPAPEGRDTDPAVKCAILGTRQPRSEPLRQQARSPELDLKPDNNSDHATSSNMMMGGGMQRVFQWADMIVASTLLVMILAAKVQMLREYFHVTYSVVHTNGKRLMLFSANTLDSCNYRCTLSLQPGKVGSVTPNTCRTHIHTHAYTHLSRSPRATHFLTANISPHSEMHAPAHQMAVLQMTIPSLQSNPDSYNPISRTINLAIHLVIRYELRAFLLLACVSNCPCHGCTGARQRQCCDTVKARAPPALLSVFGRVRETAMCVLLESDLCHFSCLEHRGEWNG